MREHLFIQVQQSKDRLMIIRVQNVMMIMTLFIMCSSHLRELGYLGEKAIYLRRRGSHVRKCYSEAAYFDSICVNGIL